MVPGMAWLISTDSSCRQLLAYITKDKQNESLVEKLCQRFRTARYAHPGVTHGTGPWDLGQGPGEGGKGEGRAPAQVHLTELCPSAGPSDSTATCPTVCRSCPSQSEASTKCWIILSALGTNCQMSASSVLS